MSILNKLKKINSNTAAQLFERHPLAAEPLEMRLQYLAGIALATAIDRDPTDTEKQAFTGLANSLSVDESDATEQLNERASVAEDDITKLFEVIRQKNASWLYLLDLAWLHASDGTLDESEVEATAQLADLLEINGSDVKNLHAFALALKLRKLADLVKMIPALPQDLHIQTHLPALLKPCFPFAGVLQNRWIDHGTKCYVTDGRSGLMWMRHKVGESLKAMDKSITSASGEPKTIFRLHDTHDFHKDELSGLIDEFNMETKYAGFSDWRLPTKAELELISTPPPDSGFSMSDRRDFDISIFMTFNGEDQLWCQINNDGSKQITLKNLDTFNHICKDEIAILLCRSLENSIWSSSP